MLKFDLSAIKGGSVTDARLELDVNSGARVLARDPMVDAGEWDVSLPGIDPRTYKTSPWRLGRFFTDATFDSPNLAVFLNSTLLHYAAEPDNRIVTLLIEGNERPLGDAPPQLVLQGLSL